MNVIETRQLTKTYGRKHALNQFSISVEEKKITALIGRNGAGKTTLLKLISGFDRQTSGELKVFSEKPYNNLKVSANMIFIDDNMNLPSSLNLSQLLIVANNFYDKFDLPLAERLIDYFSLPRTATHQSLSKGMKSTFNMIFGLCSRCALTIFDEPTTGMDSAVRKDFYRALLKDYIEHPRSIVLSSHLLNELIDILEEVILINKGNLIFHLPVEELKSYAIGLEGENELLEELIHSKEIIYKQHIGVKNTYLVIKNDLTKQELVKLGDSGIKVTAISPDDLCVHLTAETKGGIDDVFNQG
ncbi:ATP-binding cassette domain-containing protein [Aquibacillus kalidii]|uniref:ATP-binding cassette domain-containing protein n=1 Tax=Aquibacillus kalidii TaxID=2762597 RepID=UPI001645338C|nr:ABC transporter ATP-binding protein [Aquibacillus kalidii]